MIPVEKLQHIHKTVIQTGGQYVVAIAARLHFVQQQFNSVIRRFADGVANIPGSQLR
jgi:hypothetical protein